ncbi:UNVERIFIED_CONTAM: hypothetical protein Slati_4563000 [Sesamum latifolium]|uniref:Uncharacterized protein n=1 Tax=Sesamum latifolium TaxID=2727402 RepID=A0AAW2RPC9_9LAMI
MGAALEALSIYGPSGEGLGSSYGPLLPAMCCAAPAKRMKEARRAYGELYAYSQPL